MSEQLSKRGLDHLIVERHRIAERWRSERWDGLHANGPAWHDRLALMPIPGVDPDGFATPAQMVEYFVGFAERIAAPIRCGVEVTALHKGAGRGFCAQTPSGEIQATNVVVTTGPFQRAAIPPIVPPDAGVMQIHSNEYRNPDQLPEGAVLVVGSGSSGTQITDELSRAGRRVFLSVGRHERPPRRYRGRDYCWWLGVLGKWDATARDRSKEHVTIAVSGAYGGYTIDFRRLAARGVTLVGRADTFEAGAIHFLPDLASNRAEGDDSYLSVGRGRCLCFAGRAGSARGANRSTNRTRAGVREKPHRPIRAEGSRNSRDRLGYGVWPRFRLVEVRRSRRTWCSNSSARYHRRARPLLSRPKLAVSKSLELYLWR
jgi:putative flavoprotein involved in K+ transport